ncbi:MAG: endolytic transglycosylase MltG [Bacteroidota bacterium]
MAQQFVRPDRWTTPSGYLTLTVLLFLIVFLSRSHRLYQADAIQFPDSVEFEIRTPSTVQQFTNRLEEVDAVYDPDELLWASSLLGWRRVQPGYYQFSGEVSYEDMLSRLALGLQNHKRVTIPSGSRPNELASHLDQEMMADSSEFVAMFSDSSTIAQEYGWTGSELFARMYPDQYDLYWTWQPEQVVRHLLAEFQKRIEPFEPQNDEGSFSVDERLTLASIVEWEAGTHDEKPAISGLYLNRLQRGMRLQADPTILYAIGEHRRLYYNDYRLDHPYNTYRNNGLPPGPITNPDIHSLRAAFEPEDHDYLYMVATSEGRHRFTRTYQEHQDASRDWRRWLEEQSRMGEESGEN